MKRKDYISWDQYFMGVALLSKKRSKDPNTQVGACIINEDKRIIGIGYNGFPGKLSDDEFPWAREGDFVDTKYPYVVHAEMNAILNSTQSLKNATLYVTHFPCSECTKMLIQVGIKEIVYYSDHYENTDSHKASDKMLKAANVKVRMFNDFEL
ncbi:MAG: dCMP deaminase family protein [Acholeplasmataceae bacterium]|nr:dCMP deaminase family protein [Acholeplasmataceae bacterium]